MKPVKADANFKPFPFVSVADVYGIEPIEIVCLGLANPWFMRTQCKAEAHAATDPA